MRVNKRFRRDNVKRDLRPDTLIMCVGSIRLRKACVKHHVGSLFELARLGRDKLKQTEGVGPGTLDEAVRLLHRARLKFWR